MIVPSELTQCVYYMGSGTFCYSTKDEDWSAIKPGKEFSAKVYFTAPKDDSGTYIENFELALEGLVVFDSTLVNVKIDIK